MKSLIAAVTMLLCSSAALAFPVRGSFNLVATQVVNCSTGAPFDGTDDLCATFAGSVSGTGFRPATSNDANLRLNVISATAGPCATGTFSADIGDALGNTATVSGVLIGCFRLTPTGVNWPGTITGGADSAYCPANVDLNGDGSLSTLNVKATMTPDKNQNFHLRGSFSGVGITTPGTC